MSLEDKVDAVKSFVFFKMGKEIELYSELVPFQGEDVPSIRVRAVAEEPVPPRPERADFDDPLGI